MMIRSFLTKCLSVVFFGTFLSAGTCVALAGAPKKTVCSITINSNEEIELFRKNLSPTQWSFIELTEQGSADTSWLKSSCHKKIACDILLVSGHFGGSFFGKSNYRLTMEELEQSSCNSDCAGIIQQPKEVFLFGCNTLAGKQADGRTQEEYINVLVGDGFTHAQAQQVAAFRYSVFGDSFKSRMSKVFSETPRIYGFSSVGPSGKSVEKMLAKYLQSSKIDYTQFDSYASKVAPNLKLLSALSGTTIVQAQGDKGLSSLGAVEERPYCFLSNEGKTNEEKLLFIRDLLQEGRALILLPFVSEFLRDLDEKQIQLSVRELDILDNLKTNRKVMGEFDRLLSLKGSAFTRVRVDVLSIMRRLNFVTENYFNMHILNAMEIDLDKVTVEKKDLLCSLDVRADINPIFLTRERLLKSANLLRLLGCLQPKNESVHLMILSIARDKKLDWDFRAAALKILTKNISDSDAVQLELAAIIEENDELYDNQIRFQILKALLEKPTLSDALKSTVYQVYLTDRSATMYSDNGGTKFYTVKELAFEVLKKTNADSFQ